jgi:glycine betaine/choline ABC-type transport system substrate-binding protein
MKFHNILSLVAIGLGAPAFAAVTAEEAKQLGTTLTLFGAVKAGNADGSIPAYTGGLTKAPEGFKPDSGFWVDPFKDEKPVLRIDSKNMAQHAALLSEGQKHLLSKYPRTT